MIQAAQEVAKVIHEVASGRGWAPEGYRTLMTANPDWYILHVYLVNDLEPLDDGQQQEIYDDIHDKIEERFGHVPPPFNSFGLVVRGREDRGAFDSPPRGIADEIIDPDLLKPSPADVPPAGTPWK